MRILSFLIGKILHSNFNDDSIFNLKHFTQFEFYRFFMSLYSIITIYSFFISIYSYFSFLSFFISEVIR